jgi:hypothetical protein
MALRRNRPDILQDVPSVLDEGFGFYVIDVVVNIDIGKAPLVAGFRLGLRIVYPDVDDQLRPAGREVGSLNGTVSQEEHVKELRVGGGDIAWCVHALDIFNPDQVLSVRVREPGSAESDRNRHLLIEDDSQGSRFL